MFKLVLFAVAMAIGQLLFKRASLAIAGEAGLGDTLRRLAAEPAFLVALLLYTGATLLWVLALRDIPLSRAYPFAAIAFLLVPLGAALFYGEALTVRYGVGVALVIGGLLVIGGAGPLMR